MTFTEESLANMRGDALHFNIGDWIAVVHEYDGSCLRERASVKPPLWDARLGQRPSTRQSAIQARSALIRDGGLQRYLV